ncbi:unnamed protein product [Calypogeia fissa]
MNSINGITEVGLRELTMSSTFHLRFFSPKIATRLKREGKLLIKSSNAPKLIKMLYMRDVPKLIYHGCQRSSNALCVCPLLVGFW